MCVTKRSIQFANVLENIPLNPLKKQIITVRYNQLVMDLEEQTFRIAICFHTARSIITVGSLIVPALLSIQYTNGNSSNLTIYWTTWVVSLLVTVCNGLSTLMKLDKHYFHLHTVREQLISDGWQYAELTGKYSGFHTPHRAATHENQFLYFSHSIEKIRMQQVQEEYYKVAEQPAHAASHADSAKSPGQPQANLHLLLPPTPQDGDLQNIPIEVKKVMEELSSQTTIVDGQAAGANKKESV